MQLSSKGKGTSSQMWMSSNFGQDAILELDWVQTVGRFYKSKPAVETVLKPTKSYINNIPEKVSSTRQNFFPNFLSHRHQRNVAGLFSKPKNYLPPFTPLFRRGVVSSKVSNPKCSNEKNSVKETTSSSCPMFTQKPNDNRPYLNVNILGQNFLALIDSGSCSSILGSAGLCYLDKWNVPLKSDNSLQVSTADGSVQTCIGYLDLPVRGRGLFEFCRMPFGLSCSPQTMCRLMDKVILSCSSQTMCRLMDKVICPSLEPYVFYYLDDIIVCTPNFETHLIVLRKDFERLQHADFETHLIVLRKVFERLQHAKLTVNYEKCHFCRPSLKFLGFIVDQEGLRTDPDKVSAIVDYPTPKTTTQIKRLIGLVGYYRRFLKNFSALSSPITDLLRGRKKGQPITWTPEADKAFQEIKTALTTAPVLASPDFPQPFLINCDASDIGVGAVLYQAADGIEHPVAYASKNLNAAQRKYSTTEKELLAVIFAVEKFRSYVEGTRFTVITDHASLVWLHNLSNPTGRLARWGIRLSQFDFAIQHRKGSLNVVADALSRTNNEVAVLDLSSLKTDRWYRDMVAKVKENPEKFPSFRVENNYLYKHILSRNPLGGNLSDWKIVVPTPHRGEILHKYHDAETAAHLGVSKTSALKIIIFISIF
ncbi:RNase H-like domain found in reverse transcriptase [Popillia japonica]|uniref:RNase H-like domain found in reverse transcriptase n=1 Tax=Popillia japonica TaxID=7064 RepID=A0AAW1L463_POPJA